MFDNYLDLFHGYVELYTSSRLYEEPRAAPPGTLEAIETIDLGTKAGKLAGAPEAAQMARTLPTTAPFLLATPQNHCLSSGTQAASLFASQPQPHGLLLNDSIFQQTGSNSNNYSGAEQLQLQLQPQPQLRLQVQLQHQSGNPLLDHDPRLVLENGGLRLVRIGTFNSLETLDLVNIGALFVVLVLAKRLLSVKLTQWKRIDKLGLRQKDRARLDESVWRLLYYSFSSLWLIHGCLRHGSLLLLSRQAPAAPPLPHLYTFQIDWSTYAIFMIEAAFYLHATYALLLEDVWRRDSPMMLVHHLAAVFTTLSIYATRTHQIGLVSTVLRDTCDVLLEVTKLTKCFHIQHGKRVRRLGLALNCFLSVFALVFALNQLYYFPLFCLYHALNMVKLYHIQTPVMVAILTCGLIFLLLDLLWFGLILRLLYYMALARPMKDLREYDDEDDDIVELDESEPKPKRN